ncbi:hypothetical protein N7462_008329 [Penicillium macrosclerotiorum]|uniref:uncharacterized protein n=1 Tax=Penicillium macrosclerotiorum TaxID=303699 RepID=UPI0025465D2A|nr:uncharacterized protein N7462_008329 [Penicillium macrosclerotiorum]KAJ5675432.1 hypothetical protein N7462_008329 [Penicillium macrosclerotiorum]
MIQDRKRLDNAQIAEAVRSNLKGLGTVLSPANCIGRRRSITLPMLEALHEHRFEQSDLYQDEMVAAWWAEFRVPVTIYSMAEP